MSVLQERIRLLPVNSMTIAPSGDKARDVRAMFTRIARRYDLMNALMTFGMHTRWRRLAAAVAVHTSPGDESDRQQAGPYALDIGSGTGDLALALAGAGAGRVIAADFSETMLLEAQKKLSGRGTTSNRPAKGSSEGSIDLVGADALRLPFTAGTFDCVTNGFLLRNVANLPAALAEFHRVLKPDGRLVCLEITHAPRLVAPLFRPYFERIVPLLGRLIAGDSAAYRYLPASVHPFPAPERLAEMLTEAGFVNVRYRRLSIGVVCLHTGAKPEH